MSDWNAVLYNRFSKERMRPVIDLINRLDHLVEVKRIIDIGCGTGISTIPLYNKWKSAEIVGVDNSESMLAMAKEACADIKWIIRDCNEPLENLGSFNLVFSNAALQWFKDQDMVIQNLSNLLTKDGILAVQIPNFPEMVISSCIQKAAGSYENDKFPGIEKELCACYSPMYYYDVLSRYFTEVDLWQTNYYHIMDSHKDILDFYKSTGLRPYLNRLNKEEQEEFLSKVLKEIESQYSSQKDGKVLFEFKRIFFLAERPHNFDTKRG